MSHLLLHCPFEFNDSPLTRALTKSFEKAQNRAKESSRAACAITRIIACGLRYYTRNITLSTRTITVFALHKSHFCRRLLCKLF